MSQDAGSEVWRTPRRQWVIDSAVVGGLRCRSRNKLGTGAESTAEPPYVVDTCSYIDSIYIYAPQLPEKEITVLASLSTYTDRDVKFPFSPTTRYMSFVMKEE